MFKSSIRHSGAYLAIGIGCAILANIVIIGFDSLGVHYAAANMVSLFTVGGIGYWSHSRFTFRSRPSWTGYARFIAGLTTGALLSIIFLFACIDLLHMSVAIASPITTTLITGWNYMSARWAIMGRGTERVSTN